MRRLALLTVCLLALLPAFSVAQAAGDKGSVSKSWVSRTSGGASEKSFSATAVKKLYANFVWKVPAKPGQDLTIEWRDPAGVAARRLEEQDDQDGQEGHAPVRLDRLGRRQGQAGVVERACSPSPARASA